MADTKRRQAEQNDTTDTDTTTPDNTPDVDNSREEIDERIEEWKEEGRFLNVAPKATLYKYDDPKQGNAHTFAGYWRGEDIPDRHTIGLKFGSGRYFIILSRPKGEGKARKSEGKVFRIHPVYDEYKREQDEKNRREKAEANGGAALPAQPAADNIGQLKELLQVFLPIIRESIRPAPQPAAANLAGDMFNQYDLMQQILKKNLFDTAATYRDLSRRFSPGHNAQSIDYEPMDENEDEDEPQEAGILQKIISMIEPFFGLIAQKSPAAQIAAAGLKAAPQFAEILADPRLCGMIINYFDRTKGRAAADTALQNIGIDRESIFRRIPAPAAPQATQRPAAAPQAAQRPAAAQRPIQRPAAAQTTLKRQQKAAHAAK